MRPHSRQTAKVFSLQLPPEERAAYIESVSKSGAHVVAGHLARDAGGRWENELAKVHLSEACESIAYLRRVGPPHERTGSGGLDIRIIGKGPADFQGAIACPDPREPWRPCAVEAKSAIGRLQRNAFEPHQIDDLVRIEKIGGDGIAAIELRDEHGARVGTYALCWSKLETLWLKTTRAKKGKAKSTKADDLVESASVGAEELAGWAMVGSVYLARFVGGGA